MKKNSKSKKRYSPWIEGLMATFVGTLLSIILTFGINSCRESQQEKDDRHLAALMVLGNIETFARNLEVWQEENSPIDSACSIFLNLDLIGVTEDEINQHLSGLDEMKKEEEKEPKPEDFIK